MAGPVAGGAPGEVFRFSGVEIDALQTFMLDMRTFHRILNFGHHGCGGFVCSTTLRNRTIKRVGTSQRNCSGDVENMRMLMVLQWTRGASSARVVWRSKNKTSISVQRVKVLVR